MATSSKKDPATKCWSEFALRHRGQPILDSDVLYSLSEPLIDAIKAEVPDFFTAEQERFERDLARTASFGFFNGRALGTDNSERAGPTMDERQSAVADAVKQMLKEGLQRSESKDPDVEEYFEAESRRREFIETRKIAYVGWLVTNAAYQHQVKQLRRKWEAQIRAVGRLPRFPHWPFFDLGGEINFPTDLAKEFMAFYRSWGLQQLLTWEWPVPMEPDQVGGILKDQTLLAESGVTLFLPWYVLRGEKLNVHDIVRLSRAVNVPAHLREWFQKSRARKNDLGDMRFERLAFLYRYLVLGLGKRYAKACERRKGKLDLAFSRIFANEHIGDESVRRLRQELQRSDV